MKLKNSNWILRYAYWSIDNIPYTTNLCNVFWRSVMSTLLLLALGLITSLVIVEIITNLRGVVEFVLGGLALVALLALVLSGLYGGTKLGDTVQNYLSEIDDADYEQREANVPLWFQVLFNFKRKTCILIDVEHRYED